MKIVSIVGARPQFIKAAPVSAALRQAYEEVLVHTGQHYDEVMSAIFFQELGIPEPDYNLGVGSGSHGWQTAQMLAKIEEVLLAEQPAWTLVYGDTNSTLAGALASVKLQIPVAHVEAGLRSFNRDMPEEHNRVLSDHSATLLLCPTQTAVDNLHREGISQGVHLVGDVMFDAVQKFGAMAKRRSTILEDLKLAPGQYLLATVHRAYNTDAPERLREILEAFAAIEEPIVFPVHPRTRKRIAEFGLLEMADSRSGNIQFIEPVGYLDILMLEQNARIILTDSGGMQKEAYFFAVPCVTLRPETEWVETVEHNWNKVVDVDYEKLLYAVREHQWPQTAPPPVFGNGDAAEKIKWLLQNFKNR